MTAQLSSNFYPHAPSSGKTDTSRDAAPSVPQAKALQAEVMAALGVCNQTPDEVARMTGRSILSIRPRFSELHLQGRIVETGERRKNASGKFAKVWRKSNLYAEVKV